MNQKHIEAAAEFYARQPIEQSVDDSEQAMREAFPHLSEREAILALRRGGEMLRQRAEAGFRLNERTSRRSAGDMNARLIDFCDEALPARAFEYRHERRGNPPGPAEVERHLRELIPGITDEEVVEALTESALMIDYPHHPLHGFVAMRREARMETAAADMIVDAVRAGASIGAAMKRAHEAFPNLGSKAVVDALKHDMENWEVVERAILMEAAEESWHEMRLKPHPTFRIDGEPVPSVFDFSAPDVPDGRRRVAAEYATLHRWRAELLLADGEAARAEKQLRLLEVALERAGGNYDAHVIDVIDNPPAAT